MKGLAQGLWVSGQLVHIEEVVINGTPRKRLLIFFGEAKNLQVYAPAGVQLPPVGSSVNLPIARISVNRQGNLVATLREDLIGGEAK